MVRGSVRKSGQPSPKLEDPDTKYWGTNYGKELKFGTSDMSLTATEGSLFISLEDSGGITIQSDSSIVMSAKKDLEWTSEKKIGITAQQAIYLLSGSSSLVLDGNSDIRGEEVELDGLIKAPVSVEDLEPQPEAPFAEEAKKEEKKGFWNKFLDVTQVVLDVVGCIPVVGEIADLANAGISLARGDYVGAALSVASAIPFAGWAATGAKAARRVAQATKLGSKAVKAVDKTATVVKSAKEVAESLAVTGMSSLGKVYTGARSMGSNLNQAEVLQKLKTAMQNLETNRPRMALAMSMAHGTAVNYYKSEAQEVAVAKIQEEGWAPQEAITLLGILTNGGRKKGGHGGSSGIVSGGGSGHGSSGGGNHGNGSGNHGSGSGGSGKPDNGKKPDTEGTGEAVSKDGRPDFVGKLKGEDVTLPNVKTESVTFNKRNPEDTAQLRKDFNKVRKEMMKSKANDPKKLKELKQAGISDNDIEDMKEDGLVPDGWQVHHKIPLDQGGTNNLENLVLIKNDPYHKVITNEQNSLTKGMKPGDSKTVEFPIPDGDIYPPKKE
ncbi:HNH endonuclease [Paenibacillus medicaginis]|uniref:HNH endonuclease n=1 Tax=Paenibacillus medicaginis TaxID=1470560 RepID=A0ABV5C898_9BACL